VLAVVVIALAFWIQSIVGGNGDGNLTPADQLATQQALASLTPAGGARTVTPGPGTGTPTGTGTPATPGPGTPTPTPTQGAGGRTYTIQSGDNCSSIADDFNVSLADFLAINNLTEETCQQLQIGQVVRIP
jgi:LysM repeat protein